MPVFNPNIPEKGDPNYLGYTKGVTQPEANKSLGYLFSGVGNALESAAKGTETVVKSIIDDRARAAEDIRDEFTAALDKTKKIVTGQLNPQAPAPTAGTNTLTPTQSQEPPPQVKQSLAMIANIQNGYENGARNNSETFYDMRLSAIAKQLRNDFPGWRDYVDERISQITGRNPANHLIHDYLQDIHKVVSDTKEANNKIEHFFSTRMGQDDAVAVRNQWLKTGDTGPVYNWVARVDRMKVDAEAAEYRNKIATVGPGSERDRAKDDWVKFSTAKINNSLLNILPGMNADKLVEQVTNSLNNSVPMSQEEMQRRAQAVTARATQQQIGLRAAMTADRGPGQKTWQEQLGGPEEAEKYIKNAMVTYDDILKLMSEKRMDAVGQVGRTIDAKMNDGASTLFSKGNEDLAAMMVSFHVSNKYGGPNIAPLMWSNILKDNPSIDKYLSTWTGNYKLAIATGTPSANNPNQPANINQLVSDIQKYDIKSVPAVAEDVIKYVNVLSDPRMSKELRMTAVPGFFSKATEGFVGRFSEDQRAAVYARMTSKNTTDAMFDLGKDDPRYWQMYSNWNKLTFTNDVMKTEINTLREITHNPKWVLTFDSKTNQLDIHKPADYLPQPLSSDRLFSGMRNQQRVDADIEERKFDDAKKSLERLNLGLQSFSEVAKRENTSPSLYMLRFLQDIKAINPMQMEGLPSDLMEALASSIKKPVNDQTTPLKAQDRVGK